MSAQLENSAYMYDAVWTAALALNSSNSDLVKFTYNGQKAANISQSIYEKMINTTFFGLTVSVYIHQQTCMLVIIRYTSLTL